MKPFKETLKSLKTLPNKLTVSRIMVAPVLLLIFPLAHEYIFPRFFCTFLFGLAAITDFFDGYLARKFENESKLGALLDPIADKLLVTAAIVVLVGAGYLPAFLAGMLLCREVAINGIRLMAASHGKDIPVSQLGKYKTLTQDFAIAFLMVNIGNLANIGTGLIWLSLGLSYYSGYTYWKSFWTERSKEFS
tara:strand:+ start:304 stop:876 length:573 start_codon:yes stop_codon:yes gene_type:complete